jgi:hypothetical protein
MITHINTVATPANSDTIGSAELEILCLDPDIAALFAEVDAILCEALNPACRPPAPPATGCALARPRSAGRSWGALVRPRSAPVHPARAVQRSPPTPQQPATRSTTIK